MANTYKKFDLKKHHFAAGGGPSLLTRYDDSLQYIYCPGLGRWEQMHIVDHVVRDFHEGHGLCIRLCPDL